MFINGKPQFVLNSPEVFMTVQGVELPYHRLVEMSNNGFNAWSVFRSVSAPPDSWYDPEHGFHGDENFNVSMLSR
jgi:hypothetical protein